MREPVDDYLRRVGLGDADAVVALMAEEVSVEDPVGGPPGTHVVGRAEVREFFAKGFANAKPTPRRTGPVRATAGDEAAVPFRLTLTLAGEEKTLDVIDVFSFDEQGRIRSLRAFWSYADLR